ncbi:hypothetical protein AAES_28456 [Amazona aestiva]|uniref:Uncharacterized protein n=1 Tax=Amazona aestiva TaxID=12930 RepID=A0A0Q3WBZ3_AMAAE|nr:hypothetical protein AAES_28456 [Amazona aestiva]
MLLAEQPCPLQQPLWSHRAQPAPEALVDLPKREPEMIYMFVYSELQSSESFSNPLPTITLQQSLNWSLDEYHAVVNMKTWS